MSDTLYFQPAVSNIKQLKEQFEIGQPTLKGAVKAVILKQIKGPKVTIFRFKRRNKYRVKKGHRQLHTVVRIQAIGA